MQRGNNIIKVLIVIVILIIIALIIALLFMVNSKKNVTTNNEIVENSTSNKTIAQIQDEINEQISKMEIPQNQFEFIDVTDQAMILRYLQDYKEKVQNDYRIAYNLLDPEYREKRFGSIDNYQKYVQKNLEQIKQAKISKYQVKEKEGYTQYVCIDQFNNYYIIRETAVMQYTILLDDYTVDTPEYIEKYNSLTQPQRVALNIQRFVRAVNDENYTYAYSFLSEGYKNNYFKDQKTFEIYAKSIFLGKSNINFGNVSNEGSVYTCEVTLTNPSDANQVIKKTFIIRLGDGTSFEMSFNK